MKVARIAVLAIALVAGLVAWMMARNIGSDGTPAPVVVEREAPSEQVLVAARDLQPGARLGMADVRWQTWPQDGLGAGMISRSARPGASEEFQGAVARGSFVAGEPIRQSKLVQAERGGYLSAILPPGMRAVSTRTSPQTGAGGFILPNDRVDVVLTHRDERMGGGSGYSSEVVLENVRVLAIDQTVEEQDGRVVAVGNVATLALRPDEVEVLALSEQLGDISLALRSIMDGSGDETEIAQQQQRRRSGTVSVVKFGVQSRVKTN